jgi:hypothetical protein
MIDPFTPCRSPLGHLLIGGACVHCVRPAFHPDAQRIFAPPLLRSLETALKLLAMPDMEQADAVELLHGLRTATSALDECALPDHLRPLRSYLGRSRALLENVTGAWAGTSRDGREQARRMTLQYLVAARQEAAGWSRRLARPTSRRRAAGAEG